MKPGLTKKRNLAMTTDEGVLTVPSSTAMSVAVVAAAAVGGANCSVVG